MHYPFLKIFAMPQEELRTQDMVVFIKRHAGTLRDLDLSGNFLEKGFLVILSEHKVLLNKLAFGEMSLTVD